MGQWVRLWVSGREETFADGMRRGQRQCVRGRAMDETLASGIGNYKNLPPMIVWGRLREAVPLIIVHVATRVSVEERH